MKNGGTDAQWWLGSTQQHTVGSLCRGPQVFLATSEVSLCLVHKANQTDKDTQGCPAWASNRISLIYAHSDTHYPCFATHKQTHTHALMVLGIHCCGLWILSIDSIFRQLDRELSAQYQLARFHEDIISIPLPISPSTCIHWPNLCVCSYPLSVMALFARSTSSDILATWYLSVLIFLAQPSEYFHGCLCACNEFILGPVTCS